MLKKILAPFYERLSLVLIGILSLGFIIIQGKQVLDPMMFGFLFAILLLPVSDFFEKKFKFPRSLSSFSALIILVLFIIGIVYLVGTQISGLSKDWPLLQSQIADSADDIQHWISKTFHYNIASQWVYIHNATKNIMAQGASVLGTTFGAVSSLILFYLFIIIFTFFILFYRGLLLRFLVSAFREENSKVVYDIIENIQSIIRQYIIGLLLEMAIVATVSCMAFYFIGVKYFGLLGIITGLFNIIPYIGIFTALLLSSLITFATGAITKALIVAVSVVAIHAVDANFLLPMVVGSKVRLNALITFLGIIIGEMVWGLSGMFLSIPTIAILKIIFDRIDSLKPWGLLLGGGYGYNEQAEKKMKTK